MTENAVRRVRQIIASKTDSNLKLRVYIEGGGCSGFQYGFELAREVEEGDVEFAIDDVKMLVDPMSLPYLEGATVDFSDDLMGSRFVVNNPNATTTCGCGASFTAG